MAYPSFSGLHRLTNSIAEYSRLQHEYGAKGVDAILRRAEKSLLQAQRQLRALPVDRRLAAREPNNLAAIRALRPRGPRSLWPCLDEKRYASRLAGAMLGRFAGCTLGAPVEFWDVPGMEAWAEEIGVPFPPQDYWPEIPNRHHVRYQVSRCDAYTRDRMNGVPVDDDITYTQLGLLVVEDYGPCFTTDDVGKAWLKYLPYACTAEDVALKNLKKRMPAKQAAGINNPYCEWIGADIRADPWGYMAPGLPEFAAGMAYRDAYISHRRQGIYGEMFFAAAIAAAFAVDDPVEALAIGLTEIPRDCALAKAVRWALHMAPKIRNYKQARAAVDRNFAGMSGVHTINNACLTIWGLTIGGTDFTRVIGETVAMGMDNDCTAATAGSLCGAVAGRKGIPARWTRRFNNVSRSYLNGHKKFAISDLERRFTKQAQRVFAHLS